MQSPLHQGGLAVPNIKLYQLASQFRYLVDWIRNDPDSVWLDIEAFNLGRPLTLASLPFTLNRKDSEVSDGNLIVKSTLKVWDMIKKWEKRSNMLSPITPILRNTDFPPGMTDTGFSIWKDAGIVALKDLFEGDSMMSFDQLRMKYNLPQTHFFRFLQVRSFVQNHAGHTFSLEMSPTENLLDKIRSNRFIVRRCYEALYKSSRAKDSALQVWAQDLGVEIDETTEISIWECASNISICNRAKELQFRVLHRLQISSQLLHKMDPRKSDMCVKCKKEVGSYIHTIWSCDHIQDFWAKIVSKLSLFFNEEMVLDPICLLLGAPHPQIKRTNRRKLLFILTYAARKSILLKWISNKSPTLSDWHKVIFSLLPMEYLTYWAKGKIGVFFDIWAPFFDYVGPRISNIFWKTFPKPRNGD